VKKSSIRKGQIQNRGSRDGVKQEASVYHRGVEEMVWDVESSNHIACRKNRSPLRKGAAGICQRMMEVKVTQNKVRVGKNRKKGFRVYGPLGGKVCMGKAYRGDPQRVEGKSKKTFGGKNIH